MSARRGERGFTLIEILIALVILAFGLLSLARVQARASLTEVEARQRTQAMTLVQDMVDRINRKNAVAYVGEHAGYAVASCAGTRRGVRLHQKFSRACTLRPLDVADMP